MWNEKKNGMLAVMMAVMLAAVAAQASVLFDVNGDPTIHASGLWHFDGNMDEELGTGSTSSPWYGYNWAGPEDAHSGSSALDVRGHSHGMQRIFLAGDAQINGSTGFGMAMWVKRTGNGATTWNSLLGFGADDRFQLQGSGWYPGNGWYRPLFTGFGSMSESGSAAPYIKTPLNTWSFVAVFAYTEDDKSYLGWYSADAVSGETCNQLMEAPSGSTLNASDTLWLGGAWADARSSEVFVDELVISNQPQNVEWARAIFNATKDGQQLTIIRNCADIHRSGMGITGDITQDCRVGLADFTRLADNWGQQNDLTAVADRAANLLRIEMDGSDWTLTQNQLNQRTFTIQETPLLGGMMAQTFMDEALLRERFNDMLDHHCNTIFIRLGGVLDHSKSALRFIELAHQMGLQVYAIPHPPLPASLLDTYPQIAMLDQYGESMGVPCPLYSEYQDYVTALWDPNVIATSGLDGIMLDEPTFPQWRMSFDTGRLGCYCSACQARYQAMYGTVMPVVNLPDDRGTTNFNRVIAFRKTVFTEWMAFLCDHLRGAGDDFNVSIVFQPDVVSSQLSAYMTAAEATSVDVNAVIQMANLDALSVDPYWNAWNRNPSWYADFIPQFTTAPHQQGKGSTFWVQAYLESAGQIERGLHPGQVTTAINNSLGLGADGIYFWYYQGFSQPESDYNWPEYFAEFAQAVEPYLDRPAEIVSIEPVPPIAPNFSVSQLSPGTYQVQMDPNSVGDFSLKFKNAVGITRTLTFDVE